MKIRLTEKNTVWKIVQNPLKNNYYTDVMSFENEEQRGEFLNKYQFPNSKWDDLSKYVDTVVNWSDEIHFDFKIDLTSIPESEKFTRSEALRKDFAIIYDENEKKYYFCTIQANFPRSTHQYTQLSYKGELDVFFTYDIKNMFKNNTQIQMERYVMQNQWKDGFPNITVDNELSYAENLNIQYAQIPIENPVELFADEPDSFIVFLKPQRRDINLQAKVYLPNGNLNITYEGDGLVEDTIVISGKGVDNKVENFYLAIQTDYRYEENALIYNIGSGFFTLNSYPSFQKVGRNNSYKKENYYIPILIKFEDLNNKIYDGGRDNKNLYVSDLLNSPDILKVIPFYSGYNYQSTSLNTYVFSNKVGRKSLDFTSVEVGDVYRGISYSFSMLTNLKIKSAEQKTIIEKNNSLINDNFNWNQYAKMFTSDNVIWLMVNSNKQSFPIKLEMLAQDIRSPLWLFREQVYSLQGNFGKTFINNGYYSKGNLRNVYIMEEINNIENFINNDATIKKFADNAQNINVKAGIDNRNKVLGVINGALNIGAGIGNMVTGGALTKFGIDGTIETDDNDVFKRKTHTYSDVLNTTKGISEVTGGVSEIGRGITQMMQAGNEIKMSAARIADSQSGQNQIVSTGSEIEKIENLDKSINSIRLQKYELPDALKKMVAMYFHRFGYSAGGLLKKPSECINNGRIFDYIQADFTSVYSGLSENLSPQEAKIAALSISYGIRIWHYGKDFTTVGDYSKRNIIS